MSTFNGNLMSILMSPPPDGAKLDAAQIGKARAFVETVDLAGNDVDSGDSVRVGRLPANSRILGFLVVSNVSLTTATLSFGVSDDPDSFATAKAYGTTVNAFVFYGDESSIGEEVEVETDVYMAIGTANLPNSANNELKVVTLYVDLN